MTDVSSKPSDVTPTLASGSADAAGRLDEARPTVAGTDRAIDTSHVQPGPDRSVWNSLEVTKLTVSLLTLAVSALTPLLIFMLSVQVSRMDAERRNTAAQTEAERQRVDARQQGIQGLSRLIAERRARAELLISAMIHRAPIEDILERKRAYDNAYISWNTNHQSNLFLVRHALRQTNYSRFEGLLEELLIKNIFTPLDKCVTDAYYARLRNADPVSVLTACNAVGLHRRALSCGSGFADEIFKLTLAPEEQGRAEAARLEIQRRCQ